MACRAELYCHIILKNLCLLACLSPVPLSVSLCLPLSLSVPLCLFLSLCLPLSLPGSSLNYLPLSPYSLPFSSPSVSLSPYLLTSLPLPLSFSPFLSFCLRLKLSPTLFLFSYLFFCLFFCLIYLHLCLSFFLSLYITISLSSLSSSLPVFWQPLTPTCTCISSHSPSTKSVSISCTDFHLQPQVLYRILPSSL